MSHAGYKVDLGGPKLLEIGGWDALEGLVNPSDLDRELSAQVEHASMYRQCFSSTAGEYVLKDLIECFFKQRIVDPNDLPGSLAPGIRQGQADVVKRIFHMIEFANTGGGKPTGQGVITEE